MDDPNILYESRNGVARITFHRPAMHNALDFASLREFCDIVNRCSLDRSVRAVVVRGSGGRAFCAGGDVSAFAEPSVGTSVDRRDRVEALMQGMTTDLHTAISRLAWMPAPVVAAIDDVAAGAGLSLAAACDLAIATPDASFASGYAAVGLSPDGSSSWFLPRLIGRRRALELFLTGRVLDAEEALRWGLINQIVGRSDFDAAVDALASRLAAGPTMAFGGAKKLLLMSGIDSLESQMERETRQIVELAGSADAREGAMAFGQRRPARFAGSGVADA